MADPIALLTHIIEAVRFVKRQHETNLENHAECELLVRRVAALEPSLAALLQRPTSVSAQSLDNLRQIIDDIGKALDKFREKTLWRGLSRLARATKYMKQFTGLQARLAAVAGDLNLAATTTLSGDVARLLDPALRREDDLAEAKKWMESMVSARLAEMEADKEADALEFALLRQEMQGQHEAVLGAVLEGGRHAPLAEGELRQLQRQQEAFLDKVRLEGRGLSSRCQPGCRSLPGFRRLGLHQSNVPTSLPPSLPLPQSEAHFAEILDSMRLMQEEVHALHGDLGDIKAGFERLALSSQQTERRAAALRALLRDSREVAVISRLDAGGFGTIYLGTYQRANVAIKIIEGRDRLGDPRDLSEHERRDAENEALLMDRLKHPNVLPCWGWCSRPGAPR